MIKISVVWQRLKQGENILKAIQDAILRGAVLLFLFPHCL